MVPDLDGCARRGLARTRHRDAAGASSARLLALKPRQLREAGRDPELMVVVFSESDTVAHHYWRDHDAASPRHDPSASAARKGALAAIYERLDAAAGALRDAFGDDATCFVVSDHGQGGASRRVCT
jgi:predicted AlkP superfamily phosphohydrolase/phosphomutase